ncbi:MULTISPECIES: site-specific integrase [unclassified Enterococcus]|uniref:tyrosine-type recombinase/integrase n=1 Tax=unclassified Enterococcus TaxID=2608891 RepID=UPI001551BF80|nr:MULTISPECIES: site-specific integrase [unclassified Enterococcus]MBS7578330.1 site-specific integrase [Enterococcus sp. MMGLQ5-2]MBS7585567.1 site-specific integrase [Enterococcus sp. MMGLQ5-1]NPD13426.1 site-specific integrase [Enterococcus sp. MMGLQ5-1]NPD38161.1 site-specific integrase [Enterococcus sp. MMGLQ5-2]
MKIKKIVLKNGETRYRSSVFLGKNELTDKDVKKTITAKTEKELIRKVNAAIVKFERHGSMNDFSAETFGDFYNLWFESHKANIKDSSIYYISSMFNLHVLPILENINIKKVTPIFMQNVVNGWNSTGKNISSWFIYTKLVFEFARRMRKIEYNPMSDISMPKKHIIENLKDKSWSKEQLLAFFNFINDKKNLSPKFDNLTFITAIHLIAYTGLRIGEAKALNWSDVDFKNKTLQVTKTLSRAGKDFIISTPKTRTSIRSIYLDDYTIKVLKNYLNQQRRHLLKIGTNSNKILFTNDGNSYMSSSTLRKFKNLQIKAGLPVITIHGLRHTHTSIALEAGASIKEVQNRLGHANSSITLDIYTHVNQNMLKQTGEIFADFIKSS